MYIRHTKNKTIRPSKNKPMRCNGVSVYCQIMSIFVILTVNLVAE